MYQDGNYNVIQYYPCSKGMNTNISPDVLPNDYAVHLENMIPNPMGKLSMRFGTSLIAVLNETLAYDSIIMETFPFTKTNGDKQIIFYASEYQTDIAQNFHIINSNSFFFDTNLINKYLVDNRIKIDYTLDNGNKGTIDSVISNINVNNQTITITIKDNLISDVQGTTIDSIYYPSGKIGCYELKTKRLSIQMEGLSVGCVPRAVTFLNNLIICNGVDKNMYWNGNTIRELFEFVKEQAATNITKVNNNSFSFTIPLVTQAVFDPRKYPINGYIKIDGVDGDKKITNFVRNGNTVTITTEEQILGNLNSNASLYYQDFPPPFSFLKVAYNRVWALGTGAVGLNYRSPDQALRVYYTYKSNNLHGWFNESTKTVPSINLAKSHGCADNLEAIVQTDSYLAFVGRERTQVWTGKSPIGSLPDEEMPDSPFVFNSTLPIGIVHGNLFIEFPNDVTFVSHNGIISFGSLNVAKQFSATSIEAINPTVRAYIKTLENDNIAYRACRSFKYPSGAFCGFKIGNNKTLVSLYSTNVYAWSIFSGDFSESSSFLSDLNSHLYLFLDNKIFVYGDDANSIISYGDKNGSSLIFGVWETPKLSFNGKRYANKNIEMLVDVSSSFKLDDRNLVNIEIDGDLIETFTLADYYPVSDGGDSFNFIAFAPQNNIDPNEPNIDSIGFRPARPISTIKERLKFVSSRFTARFIFENINSSLSVKEIKFFGIVERSN